MTYAPVAGLCRRGPGIVALVGLVLALFGLAAQASAASRDTTDDASPPTPRLATLDWGIAQNLVAMGVSPIAVGQTAGYATWVADPPLPKGTCNLGNRAQPNLELLDQLDPDRILITRFYAPAGPRLKQIAPVTSVDTYGQPGDVWTNTVDAVKRLGQIAHRSAAAQALIARVESDVRKAADQLPSSTKPLLVLQFSGPQHVRVYGQGSLIQATMQRMGLTSAWQGETTPWGFSYVPISRLAEIKTGQMVVVGPIPVGIAEQIKNSRVWQSLPIVKDAPVLYIPQVWSFGGLPSATRFARLISHALREAPASGPGWPVKAAGA
ncbi:iron-siderophore ABC transporter substrate-binding protein [Salinisphaera sp. Q1T1-3]|uniref:iron-siderophore ABC transporter substrate-binding protein n=1 Tax=Salinisphaera sp. Q1T1-3 TaxID=2321229 RepID=UPI000E7255CD|nr:iron-siderophore ABC transporter substrate-binding protein [Salinisphaera sp. Q1T1-3]RJS93474.1 iron-siderophore ABC transporter substrate-binding protein [Salinisphaera sp. Q1T1-3]